MGKHDLKAQKLQVEVLDNLIQEFITSRKTLKYSSASIDLTDPLSLITRQFLVDYVGDGTTIIAPWDGNSVPADFYRTHFIGATEYLFRSEINDNIIEPTLTSLEWSLIGGSGSNNDTITFTSASGPLTIDFTVNNRNILFPYPHIEVWIVDGDSETLANGYGVIKNKTSGLITSISLDGVFGSGYILIY